MKDEEVTKQELEIHTRIREYQGWSLNNIQNSMYIRYDEDILYFLCDHELSEVELYGLYYAIKDEYDMYKGVDIEAIIYEAEYRKNTDCIRGKYNNFNIATKEALSKCFSFNKELLINAKQIIAIKTNIVKRFNKSKWWRLIHKRYLNIDWEV